MACAILHNFIIQEERTFGKALVSAKEEMEQLGISPYKNAPFGMSYLPVLPTDEFKMYDNISFTREGIAQALCEQEIYMPAHNIEHRQRELQQQSLQLSNGERCDREFISPL